MLSLTCRHSSTDSGFDGNDDKGNPQRPSPLSPPPSPEHKLVYFTNSVTFSTDRLRLNEKAESDSRKRQMQKLGALYSVGNGEKEKTLGIKESSEITEEDSKKSEFLLPHKLRLKKATGKNETATNEMPKNLENSDNSQTDLFADPKPRSPMVSLAASLPKVILPSLNSTTNIQTPHADEFSSSRKRASSFTGWDENRRNVKSKKLNENKA